MLQKIEAKINRDLEPLEDSGYCSGFQSPADDYVEQPLNIRDRLIKDATNTYYFESDTDQMDAFGIKKGTILIVDRSIIPLGGMLVIVWKEGTWLVRQLIVHFNKKYLVTGNENDAPIEIAGEGILIWGVVSWSCCSQLETKKNVRTGRLQ